MWLYFSETVALSKRLHFVRVPREGGDMCEVVRESGGTRSRPAERGRSIRDCEGREARVTAYGGHVVFSKSDSASRAFPLAVGEARVDALLAKQVATSVDDNTLEAQCASRALEHFLKAGDRAVSDANVGKEV